MADAELSAKISTTSDIPQSMDKAKTAVAGFEKQVEGIGKKFSSSFKDIFLSFLGPMALLGIAINYIGGLIAESQKRQAEANQAAIDRTNELMSVEDQYYANKRNNEKKAKETVVEARLQRDIGTAQFLKEDPRGKAIMQRETQKLTGLDKLDAQQLLPLNKRIQAEVQGLIAEDIKKNPDAAANLSDKDKAQKASDDAAKAKGTTFKGPEGFSNVVGVGSNPVMEAMTMQLEETRRQTALLEIIARPAGGGVPVDYTKSTSSSPSRAAMLSGK